MRRGMAGSMTRSVTRRGLRASATRCTTSKDQFRLCRLATLHQHAPVSFAGILTVPRRSPKSRHVIASFVSKRISGHLFLGRGPAQPQPQPQPRCCGLLFSVGISTVPSESVKDYSYVTGDLPWGRMLFLSSNLSTTTLRVHRPAWSPPGRQDPATLG